MIRKMMLVAVLCGSSVAWAQEGAGGGTHYSLVLRTVGVQGIASAAIGAGALGNNALQTDIIGIRYWFKERIGLEAGIGIALVNANNNTVVGFGFGGGIPIAITIHKHITTFVEPFADVFIFSPGGGASTIVRVDLRADIGFEWQLGFWETHTLALLFKLGPGFQIVSGGGTAVAFATSASSVAATVAGSLGLAFYF